MKRKCLISAILVLSLLFIGCDFFTKVILPDMPSHNCNFSAWVVNFPATCDAAGQEIRNCSCGKEETKSIPRLTGAICDPAHIHSYGDWITNREPTCDTGGEQMRSCFCGDIQRESIPRLTGLGCESGSNNLADGTYLWEGATDSYGSTAGVSISPNNVSFNFNVVQGAAGVYPYAIIASTPNYNWSNFGSITITYTSDNSFDILLVHQELAATGATFRYSLPASEASRTVTINASDFAQPSWVQSKITLNKSTIEGINISALPNTSLSGTITMFQLNNEGGHTHSFGNWTTITPATCNATGQERGICSCGETETRIIPQLTGSQCDPISQQFTVWFDANGGTFVSNQTVNSGSFITLPSTNRDGFTFNGWFTAASGGTRVGGAGSSYTVNSNITLFAQWTQNAPATGTLTIVNSLSSGHIPSIAVRNFNTGAYIMEDYSAVIPVGSRKSYELSAGRQLVLIRDGNDVSRSSFNLPHNVSNFWISNDPDGHHCYLSVDILAGQETTIFVDRYLQCF